MRTPRDAVAESRTRTKSVRNSLTAMTRVTGVGTVVDRADRALRTLSGATVVTAISTVTGSNADAVIVTAIGDTIGIGVVAGRHS